MNIHDIFTSKYWAQKYFHFFPETEKFDEFEVLNVKVSVLRENKT